MLLRPVASVAGGVAVGVAANFVWVKMVEPLLKALWPRQPRLAAQDPADLLARLFFDSANPVEVVPAGHYPLQRADKLVGSVRTYDHEFQVMCALRDVFPVGKEMEIADSEWMPAPENSRVCLGSGVSNLCTRSIMGDPLHRPGFEAQVPGRKPVELAYQMAYIDPAQRNACWRLQYGKKWPSPESVFYGRNSSSVQPKLEPQNRRLKDDYLLVTKLPGLLARTHTVIFSGLHGTATRGAELLFRSIEPRHLMEMERLLGGKVNAFQAVFHTFDFRESDGSDVPQQIELVTRNCPPCSLTA